MIEDMFKASTTYNKFGSVGSSFSRRYLLAIPVNWSFVVEVQDTSYRFPIQDVMHKRCVVIVAKDKSFP